MEPQFWHERWQTDRLGFHENQVNAHLQRHWPEVTAGRGERVFVPLAGKAHDLAWLREQGHSVVGVEISPIACRDFFRERGVEPTVTEGQRFTVWAHDDIELLCGDYFDLTAADLGPVELVYDRAALIALPESMRQDYVDQLLRIPPDARRILLISLQYPEQDSFSGPPFSVPDTEVAQRFEKTHRIRRLHHQDVPEDDLLVQRGMRDGTESVFLLEG